MIGEYFNSQTLINQITGNVTLELRDASSGKVQEKIQSKNFIAQAGTRHLKYVQRANFFKNGISTLNANADLDYAQPLSQDHLILTSSTDATDPAGEWNMFGKLIGYAGKYTYSGLDTYLGSPNVSLSEATPTYTKWVFDWSTSTGNGTIGSLGWVNAPTTYQGTASNGPRFYTSATVQDVKTLTSQALRIARKSSSEYYLAQSGTPAITVTDGNFSQTSTFSVGGQFRASTSLTGIAWDSANNKLWVLGVNGSNAPIIAAYNSAGTLQNGPTTVTNRAYQSLTFDGTNLWTLVSSAANTLTLYKIGTNGSDISNVTINLPSYTGTYTGEFPYALAYESSNSWIYIATYAISYSGNTTYTGGNGVNTGPSGAIRAYDQSGNEVMPPVSLAVFVPSLNNRYFMTAMVSDNRFGTYWDFEVIDKQQILMPHWESGSNYTVKRILFDAMGSRVLLPSPINKTNSQTLRITYQMDYT